jgi:integrase
MKKLELLELWVSSLPKSVLPVTIERYKEDVKVFLDWLPDDTISINETDVDAYYDSLINRCTKGTINNYMYSIKKFSKWFGENWGKNFAKHIKDIGRDYNITETLTIKQLERVLSIAKKSRDRLMIIFMGFYGQAPKDIVNLTWDEVYKGEMYKANEREINKYISQRGNISYSDWFFVSDSNNNKNGQLTEATVSYICKDLLRKAVSDDPHLTAYSITMTYFKIKAWKELALGCK